MELYSSGSTEESVGVVDQSPIAAPSRKLRIASLFAGIGGFDRAFETVGCKVVFQCEIDRFCRAVLRRHWPNATLSEDIRTLDPNDIPEADVWTAGFPCQDVSLARGNHGRTGLKGNHTSLFFRLMELVAVKKPKVILLENVVGLLNSHRGQDFAIILRELTSRGYAVSWRVMNARYFGAPQSRARVFICAWRGDFAPAVATLFENTPGAKVGPERSAFVTENFHKATGATVPTIAYCVAATSGRHTGNDWSRSYISYPDGVRRPTPTESERLQGYPKNWTIPDQSFSVPARGLDSDRYKAVGNAVAVPVVQWIAKRLTEQFKSGPAYRSSDLAATVGKLAPDLTRQFSEVELDQMEIALASGDFAHRWKSGGCAWDSQILEGSASAAPAKVVVSTFVDALDEEMPDERYFLTSNAAAGILRRADSVGRNLFPPMRKALENLVGVGQAAGIAKDAMTGDSIGKPSLRTPRPGKRVKVERSSNRTERRISRLNRA